MSEKKKNLNSKYNTHTPDCKNSRLNEEEHLQNSPMTIHHSGLQRDVWLLQLEDLRLQLQSFAFAESIDVDHFTQHRLWNGE